MGFCILIWYGRNDTYYQRLLSELTFVISQSSIRLELSSRPHKSACIKQSSLGCNIGALLWFPADKPASPGVPQSTFAFGVLFANMPLLDGTCRGALVQVGLAYHIAASKEQGHTRTRVDSGLLDARGVGKSKGNSIVGAMHCHP